MPPAENTISKTNASLANGLDFQALREIGLAQIQSLSEENWTDHNLHDPGITVLEALAYALLDHGYRAGHNIEDLLAGDKSSEQDESTLFYTAAEILGNNPITINDYRKLLLDIPGVRNAWLDIAQETYPELYIDFDSPDKQLQTTKSSLSEDANTKKLFVNGLYNVSLELDFVRRQDQSDDCAEETVSTDRILTEVRRRLFAHRNLSEDFVNIRILQDEQIAICATLELGPGEIPEEALTEMFVRVRNWLSPDPVFYTLQDMVKRGKTMEEIFEGRPLLPESHGFVDLEELDAMRPGRRELHTSDLYSIMLGEPEEGKTPAIRAIRGLKLLNYISNLPQSSGQEWCLPLTVGYRPVLAVELCEIQCLKEGLPVLFDRKEVQARVNERLSNARKSKLRPYELDRLPPQGIKRDLASYYSIQHDFPAVYGIGEGGLPASASASRRAQALQLKGYLLFFDQLLANFLAQLSRVKDFFVLKHADPPRQTYFAGKLDSVPDVDMLVRGAGFNKDGDQITGESIRVKRGQPVFYPEKDTEQLSASTCEGYETYVHFDSPQQRDAVINRVITAFENENYRFEFVEDEQKNNLIRFITPVLLPNGAPLTLLSRIAFPEYNQLEAEAEAITFLFISPDFFQSVDIQDEAFYSFEVVYKPPAYDDVLQRLQEAPGQAESRRDKFLDHLLARFAEDFSDYALLRFASGEKQPTGALIRDKEQLLADYPVISRRRSTGFDVSAKHELWDTDNVTGLERRVGGLMGIEDWQRRTLAPFYVQEQQETYNVALRDFRGRVLFQNLNPISNDQAFVQSVVDAAAQPDLLSPIDCAPYHRFGIELQDGEGCVLASHPDYYGDSVLRDLKRGYISAV